MNNEEQKNRFEVIAINKVEVVRNVRTNTGDVAGLMSSIAKQGLLHPIGVYMKSDGTYVLRYGHRRLDACTKLGWQRIPAMISDKEYDENSKDFLLENFSENKNRSETSPIEDGKVFIELGLPPSEIANETGIKIKYIRQAIDAYKLTPEKYKPDVGIRVIDKFEREAPLIEVKKANMITRTAQRAKLTNEETEELFEWAKTHPTDNLRRVLTILDRATNTKGDYKMSIKEVLSRSQEIKAHTLFITISEKEADRLTKYYGKSLSEILVDRLRGDKIPSLGNLVIKKGK